MEDLVLGVVSNALWVVFGALGALLARVLLRTAPTRRLWRLKDHTRLTVCAATSTLVDTREYMRPTTGIGQVRALALIVTSLNRAYRRFNVRSIHFSEEQIHDRIENDLILLGGPKNNRFTRTLLDKLRAVADVVDQQGAVISWRLPGEEAEFQATTVDHVVQRDFGLVIRMVNPFSSRGTMAFVFSGGHTYGTIAAARMFTETLYRESMFWWRRSKDNLVMVVSCDVVDGYPVSLKLERRHEF